MDIVVAKELEIFKSIETSYGKLEITLEELEKGISVASITQNTKSKSNPQELQDIILKGSSSINKQRQVLMKIKKQNSMTQEELNKVLAYLLDIYQ